MNEKSYLTDPYELPKTLDEANSQIVALANLLGSTLHILKRKGLLNGEDVRKILAMKNMSLGEEPGPADDVAYWVMRVVEGEPGK